MSSAAFSVAHLRFAQFRYYVALSLVLGWLYWRRGLVASVAAHACFNGMLVVAAVAASHGSPVVLFGGGASITVPAAWHTVAHPAADVIAAGARPRPPVSTTGRQVAAGASHSLYLRDDATVATVGWNGVGQVGDATTVDRHSPVPVAGLGPPVTAISAGFFHSVAS